MCRFNSTKYSQMPESAMIQQFCGRQKLADFITDVSLERFGMADTLNEYIISKTQNKEPVIGEVVM